MCITAEVEEINEFVKQQTGHPIGNTQMIMEFAELIRELKTLNVKTKAFKVRWKIPEHNKVSA